MNPYRFWTVWGYFVQRDPATGLRMIYAPDGSPVGGHPRWIVAMRWALDLR